MVGTRLYRDLRRVDLGRNTHPRTVAAEPIGSPLCRGRKVEFVIRDARRTGNESLEAGVPPELLGPCRSGYGRHSQIAYPADHGIGKLETAGLRTRNFHFYVRHYQARRIWMKSQDLVHSGILAPRVAHDMLAIETATTGSAPCRKDIEGF